MPKDFYKDVKLPRGFDKKLVEKAFEFAKKAHRGQKRKSGQDYITHPLAVARILLELKMGSEMIAAALLHDIVEDTDLGIEAIEKKFAEDVTGMVRGLTALRQVDFSAYSNSDEAEAARGQAKNENLRQLFLSMSEDVRVVVIKLADRLHNMETVKALSAEDQKRVSLETLNIFAPLALRLGMGEIKGRLEDLAFPIAHPEEHAYLKKEANRRYKAADRYTIKMKRIVKEELEKVGVSAAVEGRAKHIYSLYKKITRPGIDWDFDKIYDLVALRIITKEVPDCYKILGAIHGRFRPLPDYVRDYIAAPKPNGYRSIHTTVFGPEGKVFEVQIRTEEMHEEAEYGVASHLSYTLEKSTGKKDEDLERGTFAERRQTEFLKRIREWQDSVEGDDFLEGLKMEFLDERIYVFSPRGDIFDLPVGSTPIDFAYEVHSRIGDTCVGAKVNKKIVPLDTKLKTRDVVEAITDKKSFPKRGWLDFVKTSRARQHIRSYYRKFEFEKNRQAGEDIVRRELENLGYDLEELGEKKIKSAIQETSFKSADDLFASVGGGLTGKRQAVKILLGKTFIPEETPKKTVSVGEKEITSLAGMKVNVAPCCQPKKEDRTVCYVTRGRGLTVHKSDCHNLKALERERLFEFNPWQKEKTITRIEVVAEDRIGLIRDISEILFEKKINIEGLANEHEPGSAENRFILTVGLADLSECAEVIEKISKVEGVSSARRLKQPAG